MANVLLGKMSTDPESLRFIKEAKEFLSVSKHLERKIGDHDERMSAMLQIHSHEQWQQLSQRSLISRWAP